METRKAIYNFIMNSEEYEKYNNRKRVVSISSSIIFGIGFIILFSMLIAFNFKILFLILGLSIILLNFIYIFASISIFLKILKKNIYSQINENIIEWIKKEKKDIKIENINVSDLKISSKIRTYNYKQTTVSLMTDDIIFKIKEIINSL